MTKHIFIDDTGDSGLSFDNSGTSSHYILAAVIVDSDKLPQVALDVELVRKRNFQNGEMKSSKVARDDIRRIRILEEFQRIDFNILSFVIHKDRLAQSGGFNYHEPFVKFLGGRLHRELHIFYPGSMVVADEHGDAYFMQKYGEYIKQQPQITLFDPYNLSFAASNTNVMLQLADFLAGTIALGFERRRKSSSYANFIRLIEDKVLGIKEWPGDYVSYLDKLSRESNFIHDSEISSCAIRLADNYVLEHAKFLDMETRARVTFLEHLLFKLRHHRPDQYVFAREIKRHLDNTLDCKYNNEQLRNNVVGPLRDHGVIIASCRSGYKIPVSRAELYAFFDNSKSVIDPMVGRLRKCRDQICIATSNEFDILSDNRYITLRKLIDG